MAEASNASKARCMTWKVPVARGDASHYGKPTFERQSPDDASRRGHVRAPDRCLTRPRAGSRSPLFPRPPRRPRQGSSRRARDRVRDVRLSVPLLPLLRPHHHAAPGKGIRADGEGPVRLRQSAAHHAAPQRRRRRRAGHVRGPAGEVLAPARPAVPASGCLGLPQGPRALPAGARRLGRARSRPARPLRQLQGDRGPSPRGCGARRRRRRRQHAHVLHRGRVARRGGPRRDVPDRTGLGLPQQDGQPGAVMGDRPSFIYRLSVRLAERALPLAARFDKKIARGVDARRGVLERLAAWGRSQRDPKRRLVWVHAPSVGEGLQAKPVLETLRAERPQWQLVYTFFSPSAERLARTLPVDFADYLPFDRAADVAAALDALQPSALVFSKLDVWPELTLAARRRGAKLGLISATVALDSSRLRWPARRWAEPAYRALDRRPARPGAGRAPRAGAARAQPRSPGADRRARPAPEAAAPRPPLPARARSALPRHRGRSRRHPRRLVRRRRRRVRGRRLHPRGAAFRARAGRVRSPGHDGPPLAHEPRRRALDRAGRRGGAGGRWAPSVALPTSRLVSRPGRAA